MRKPSRKSAPAETAPLLNIDIAKLKNALEHDAVELNLAMLKENDAISHRKACQTAYENSARDFELGYHEIVVATTVVRKAE